MTAPLRPQPRPGVLDIDPYVPGKSTAPGVARVFKLSSNETPLGPSPKAIAAYRALAEHLEDYPDGAARPTCARRSGAPSGSTPTASSAAPAPTICSICSRDAYLADGDEAIHTTHGFLVYPIAIARRRRASRSSRAEKNYTADVDAILAAVSERTKIVFLANPNNPTGTYVPFDEVKRLHAGLPPHVLLVLDAAYAEYVRRNDYEAGIELVATSENVVMCRTFSKIHGLAALRLGWITGPRMSSMRSTASAARSTSMRPRWRPASPHRGHRACGSARARTTNTGSTGCTTEIRKLGLEVTPSVANFVLIHFPSAKADRRGRRRVPHQARPDPAPRDGLQAAERAAHDGRQRGGEPAGGRGAGGVPGRARANERAAALQPPRADRRRPDRLLDRARGARAGRGRARSSPPPAPPRRAGASPSSGSPIRWSRPTQPPSKAPTSSSSAFRSAPAARSRRRSARISQPGAIVSDVGSVKGVGAARHGARTFRRACISCPAHPVAGTEYSGPDAGFAELFVNRWCILTPPREHRSRRGRAARRVLAPARRQCRDHDGRASRPRARRSPATCRTSSPTRSSAPPTSLAR